ncbi:MAG: ABC transporter permease [Devosia sp.]
MMWLVLKKLGALLIALLVASLLVFFVLEIVPGDQARYLLGQDATPDAVAALRLELGLDRSLPERYLGWLGPLLVGQFGSSLALGAPIGTLIAGRLAVTIPLLLMAAALALLVGTAAGALAVCHRGTFVDRTLAGLMTLGRVLPPFWLGMLLVLSFALTLRWLPPGGFIPWLGNPVGALRSLVLPVLALALPHAAMVATIVRANLIAARQLPYVQAARARGLTMSEAVLQHGLRNILAPIIGALGRQFNQLVASAMLVETVFYLPGLGRLLLDAVIMRDLPVVRGTLLVLIAIMALSVFATDLIRTLADPRQRPALSA